MPAPGLVNNPRWQALRAQVLRESTVCYLCGQPGATTVDHIQERWEGGDIYDRDNLAPAHVACNSRKHAQRKAKAAATRGHT